MLIGVPKEIKTDEYRVGLVPCTVKELTNHGHQVIIETQAGSGIGHSDADYVAAGAKIIKTSEEIFQRAELIVKVKEPQPNECKQLSINQIIFTYLHLAADKSLTQNLIDSKCTAIGYETVTDDFGRLPLLLPMSEVAGRISVQVGAHCLEKPQGGSGILLGGMHGVEAANVLVIGGGIVGSNAIRMALGMEANVTVLDKNLHTLQELDKQFGAKLHTIFATETAIEKHISSTDLVIGAVLVAGGTAPKLIRKEYLHKMRPGSVIVDVAIDQGGCAETSKATTHSNPTYLVDGVLHYCVTNMPGAVPRTAASALNNATLPYILAIANDGLHKALHANPHLLNGLNVHNGHITYKAVADDLNYAYVAAEDALAN